MSVASSSSSSAAAASASSPSDAAAPSAASAASSSPARSLEDLRFDNRALRELPVDTNLAGATTPRQVTGACFSLVQPTPLLNPRLVAVSTDALLLLEVDPKQAERDDFAAYFSGNKLLPGSRPAAHCYCGYQFGHFSGQLGDGATMYLGEVLTSSGGRVELQLKGAGPTPYSRAADGRKVLRSSVREFLCSEAHHYLGIPTTRAATLVTSDSRVIRDKMYDGNETNERCTVISRLAETFLRFGSFEITKGTDPTTGRKGPSEGRTDILRRLLDYVVDTFYADLCAEEAAKGATREQQYLAFFRELTRRTAHMVAKWQSVGWCHGVLNTDNMSIVGLTIDFGPFGFMEEFDPQYICNSSDNEGRYRYESQPEICGWNLLMLSKSLAPLGISPSAMQTIINGYEDVYTNEYNRIMNNKMGLGVYKQQQHKTPSPADAANAASSSSSAAAAASSSVPASSSSLSDAESEEKSSAECEEIVGLFLATLASTGGDFTNCFRCLSRVEVQDPSSHAAVLDYLVGQSSSISTRIAQLAPRIPAHQLAMIQGLMRSNPEMFARPGMEEQVEMIQAEIARASKRDNLRKMDPALKAEQDRKEWSLWLDRYVDLLRRELEQAQTLCSDALPSELHAQRARVQNSHNPKYILRNWIAQTVIEEAEKGNYRAVQECLDRLKDPYAVPELDEREEQTPLGATPAAAAAATTAAAQQCVLHWNRTKPEWACSLKVSCSS